jgi:hypothetical protein
MLAPFFEEDINLDNQEAINLVKDTFAKILNAKDVQALKEIISSNPHLYKQKIDRNKYPELKLQLTAADIKQITTTICDENFNLHSNISEKLKTPLEKLLYALIWKNGDLQKINHIIKGAKDVENIQKSTQLNKEGGQIFKQFGRHLVSHKEPIVDQHTLRAFIFFKSINETKEDLLVIRKKDSWGNNAKTTSDIETYKQWINKSFKQQREDPQYLLEIDSILFALGKAIKQKRQKNG